MPGVNAVFTDHVPPLNVAFVLSVGAMFVQLSHAYTCTGIAPESPVSKPALPVMVVFEILSMLPRCSGDSIVSTGAVESIEPTPAALVTPGLRPLRFFARTSKLHVVPSPHDAMNDGDVLFVGV